MNKGSKSESMFDIAMSMIPVAGSIYHGRKRHREGFLEASEIYEKKFRELADEKRQMRRDVLGEEQIFICPQAWDNDFWQKKMEVFVKEQIDAQTEPREILINFLQFCIDNFPKRRLAQTLADMKAIRDVLKSSSRELAEKDQEDIELAIDFLCFYREKDEIKKIKHELVAVLPSTQGCNFLVLGKTGVGKSSLLNSLLGAKHFDTGTGRPVTGKGIYEFAGELDGIKVRVFDSWGLEAGEVDEWHRLIKDAQEKHDLSHKVEDWFHAAVYCIGAGGSRIEDVDRDIIRSLLADDMYVVVALTKADQCSVEDAEILRKELCASHSCEKLLPQNVIETCVGAETRSGKTEPLGIDELKRAILLNYKKTIQAQLPARCIYLAQQEIVAFHKDAEDWISSCEWKYDENDNNRPLKQKCDAFVNDLLHNRFPRIVQRELNECVKHGRNLAAALHFEDVEDIIPNIVSPEMGWLETFGNFIAKTFAHLNPFGKSDDEEEQDRLRAKLDEFCDNVTKQVENQKDAITKKVKEVLKW